MLLPIITLCVITFFTITWLTIEIVKTLNHTKKTYWTHKKFSREEDKFITFEEFMANWNIINYKKIPIGITVEDNGSNSIRSKENGLIYFNHITIMFKCKFYRFNMIEYYKYYNWFINQGFLKDFDFWV